MQERVYKTVLFIVIFTFTVPVTRLKTAKILLTLTTAGGLHMRKEAAA